MSRGLTEAMLLESAKGTVRPAIFVLGEFDSGSLRLWSGLGSITWNGALWTGAGSLLRLSEPEETSKVKAAGLVFMLKATDDIRDIALLEDYQSRPVTMWFGFLTPARAVIANPVESFKGAMDVMEDEETGEDVYIRLSVENALIVLERENKRLYSKEDQQEQYPDDTFFDYVTDLQNREIILE